jgi:signal transduction histidine kinase
MESTGFEPNPEPVAVADAVAETVGLSASLARAKDLILDVRGDTSIIVHADPTLLKRVLTNLIGNAIKFTDEGSVTVAYERLDGSGRIDVTDTGIGIDESFIPEMFDEFTQESSGRDRTHGGSGLGLAICKKLVEAMQGRIDVRSKKGDGTVMSVILPLDRTDPEAKTSTQDQTAS